MNQRSYVTGLPVIVTVADDGTVSYVVDLSEVADLDADMQKVDATVFDADVATIAKAHSEGKIKRGDEQPGEDGVERAWCLYCHGHITKIAHYSDWENSLGYRSCPAEPNGDHEPRS